MERCVALLILAALVCTAGHQQLHHLRMPYGIQVRKYFSTFSSKKSYQFARLNSIPSTDTKFQENETQPLVYFEFIGVSIIPP